MITDYQDANIIYAMVARRETCNTGHANKDNLKMSEYGGKITVDSAEGKARGNLEVPNGPVSRVSSAVAIVEIQEG
jgi:hypothetical protein